MDSLLFLRRSAPVMVGLLIASAGWCLAADEAPTPAQPPQPTPQAAAPKDGAGAEAPKGGRDVGHMHNVHAITPRLIRGSAPVDENDFALLAKMGVKVVVSVDGARPDVAAAKKHGLRYVHVPFGYAGVPREKQVLLYKAFATLEGPFFVHCHHGKHRGPAACAIGLLGTEGWKPEQVVDEMKLAGTATKYDGLYALPGAFVKPTAAELAAAPKELPEVTEPAPFTDAMVELDGVFDRIKAVRVSKWSAPVDHPDVDPSHEAVILAESFREMVRGATADGRSPAFVKHLADSEAAAWELSKALDKKALDAAKAQDAFARIEASCTACHKAHRDPATALGSR
jgi:protein tyrosine phosphatase (PTP) superfamily phosphohydrolase (DUF442 family)